MKDYQLFWGDLHNHNAVGYARGSIERTYDIAQEHLDVLAFTPHSQWHDMPTMPNDAHMKWVDGFKVLHENWPKVQRLAAESNRKGKFVSILAYEWHSSFFGDYCLYYPADHSPLKYHDHVRDLQNYVKGTGAMIVPHHLAYKQGWRGANWDYLEPSVSPVMEVMSEHGLSEHDRAGFRYIRHSMGGRWTRNTLQAALQRGFRPGVIASSDDHLGYPGAYGEGLAGIWAKELSRAAILDALWNRRTIAVSGDRIRLFATLNDQLMGSEIPFTREREFEISCQGKDEIEKIEILKHNRVVYRYFPEDYVRDDGPWPGRVLSRIEFGWGPWGDLNMTRIADWDATITVTNGKIASLTPCFQSGPFDEDRRDHVVERKESSCRVRLFTSRKQAYEEKPTKSVLLEIIGGRDAVIRLAVSKPAPLQFQRTLGELAENSEVEFTGPFTAESVLIHRLVTPELYNARFRHSDYGRAGRADYYYVRATQANGHQAWSSPFWVEA
ncbi:MAG: DUF3604 domain-containing protein [Bryobacterales bacterium]|nr:DUF3604 domain-containing protein [Bryobacterales bacterium]